MIPTSCPRCESEQPFIPRLRDTDHRWQEEYIRCPICRYEQVLRHTTPEIEKLRIKLRKFSERKQYEMDRHGTYSGTLAVRHREARKEMSALITELYAEVREVNGSPADEDTA